MTNGKKDLVSLCGGQWQVKELTGKNIARKYGELGESLDGFVDFDNEIIYINKEMTVHRRHLALVHEMLHVVYERNANVGNDEEEAIKALEHGVLEIVVNYPWRDRSYE